MNDKPILSDNLRMTNPVDLIAKIVNRRVSTIKIGEMVDLVPKAKGDELRHLQKALKNKAKLDTDARHREIGCALEIIIYRIMQDEETDKLKEWGVK